MRELFIFVALVCLKFSHSEWTSSMENPNLLEGDIILDPDEQPGSNNGFASIKGGRWPNAIIPYKIDLSTPSSVRDNIPNAIAAYQKYTCLRFKRRSTEKEYLRFHRGDGCSSPVGYRKYRRNDVSLAYGCSRVGTIIHEIGHSIGLYHEQSRPDRNNHVIIHWENIEKGMEYNFDKYYYSTIDSLGTPYDYLSIMHYGRTAFGKGKMTIETKDPKYRYRIGRRTGLSPIDIKQINLMYCNGANPSVVPTVKETTANTPNPTVTGNCTDEWNGEICAFYTGAVKNCKESKLVREKCCKACRAKYGTLPTVPPTTQPTTTTNVPTPTTTAQTPKPITTTGHCTDEWEGKICAFYTGTVVNCKDNSLVRVKCCKTCRAKWGFP